MSCRLLLSIVLGMTLVIAPDVAFSQSETNSGKSSRPARSTKIEGATEPASRAAAGLDTERETAALVFAHKHHPELASLLQGLKARSPRAYQEAIRDLSRVGERLARFETRSPDRYQSELELWKIDSRIRLLAARLAMNEDEELQRQLQSLLHKKFALRVELLEEEQKRITVRLQKIEGELSGFQKDRDALVAAEQERLLNSARASAPKPRRNPSRGGATTSPVASPEAPAAKSSAVKSPAEKSPKTSPRQPD